MWCLILGKAIMGLSLGVSMSCLGRTLEEFTPPNLYGSLMITNMFMQTVSVSFAVIGMSIPLPTDEKGLETTQYWRIFLGMPLIFCVGALLLMFFVIKHEPPKYYIAQHRYEEALESIKTAYAKEENH
jgi:MFS family permease